MWKEGLLINLITLSFFYSALVTPPGIIIESDKITRVESLEHFRNIFVKGKSIYGIKWGWISSLWESTDHGSTWVKISENLTAEDYPSYVDAKGLFVDLEENIFISAVNYNTLKGGTLKSSDGGKTFKKVLSNDKLSLFWKMAETRDGTLFLGEYTLGPLSNCYPIVWISHDHGETWEISLDLRNTSARHIHGVFADPYSDAVYATFGDITYYSTWRWKPIEGWKPFVNSTQYTALAFTKDYIYAGTDLGTGNINGIDRITRDGIVERDYNFTDMTQGSQVWDMIASGEDVIVATVSSNNSNPAVFAKIDGEWGPLLISTHNSYNWVGFMRLAEQDGHYFVIHSTHKDDPEVLDVILGFRLIDESSESSIFEILIIAVFVAIVSYFLIWRRRPIHKDKDKDKINLMYKSESNGKNLFLYVHVSS